jgi:hypothetical protein
MQANSILQQDPAAIRGGTILTKTWTDAGKVLADVSRPKRGGR